MTKKSKIDHYTDKEALDYHRHNKPGKIEISSSKNMTTKRDLALAYSPGVAAPVKAISENPETAFDYTSKGNLVAVISNGTAILGMGNLGALASKPVMEGKAVLFKRFADIDSIDLEIDSNDTNEIINSIKNFNYGPLNVDEPGDYWDDIADYWNTTEEAAKKSLCGNCVAFDISPRMEECMPGSVSQDEDGGRLGYCWMHHFKCHSLRTCHTWAKGGPITDDEVSLEWTKRNKMAFEK